MRSEMCVAKDWTIGHLTQQCTASWQHYYRWH